MSIFHAGCLVGVQAHPVVVEARVGAGLPGVDIVGLPERGVRESRVRVRSSLQAIGVAFPKEHLVINLAPGDLKKGGACFDLAIALSVLSCCGVDADVLQDTLLLGELSLDGELRPVRGVLAQLRSGAERGLRRAIIPRGNETEGALAQNIDVRVASTLREVLDHIGEVESLPVAVAKPDSEPYRGPDLADVRGQPAARRALEIAAAGGHHLLMLGPPGAGKTMLARRLPSLLPKPNAEEALTIAAIASVVGAKVRPYQRPFRAPHHTASSAAMVGGGDPVRPGEVTLAHGGVLFLDELPEFRRDVIETFRTTMEQGEVSIARARQRLTMPAAPLVVAAMNPCPCGYAGDPERLCTCHNERIENYRGRLSGPLVDRFDMHVAVRRVPAKTLRAVARGEDSASVAERVALARNVRPKADSLDALLRHAEQDALALVDLACDRLGLSARGYVKALRVALTISALEGTERIRKSHVAEAIQYRLLDRHQPPSWKAAKAVKTA